MAYDETTRKARPERQERNSCSVIGGGACFLTDLDKMIKLKPPQHEISLFSKAPCVAIQKAPQWTIYLYDSITYLRVLADPTSRPHRKQTMPPNHSETNQTPSISLHTYHFILESELGCSCVA